jgi:hypothetical protein
MAVNENIPLLIELQKIDSQILSTRVRIKTIPGQIASEDSVLSKAKDAYEQAKQKHELLEKKKRDKEREIEEIQGKILKLRQRTTDIKTNKEYQAHLREIEKIEEEIRLREDEVLSLMESIEESSKAVGERKGLLGVERERIEGVTKELQKDVRHQEEILERLKESRKGIVSSIRKDIYKEYMELLKVGRGIAVVEAKGEICQGCNIHIPPQFFVEIKSTDEIFHCPQCRRILYYLKPENEAETGLPAAPAGPEGGSGNV